MKTKALIAAILLAVPALAGAVPTTFTFEQDDANGVALRITGKGLPEFLPITSPSGLWDFQYISLYAAYDDQYQPDILAFYFDVWLQPLNHTGMGNHPFNEYFVHDGQGNFTPMDDANHFPSLQVAENSFDFHDEAFDFWRIENFLRIDKIRNPKNPQTWDWTFYTSLVRPEPVPDGGASLLLGLAGLLAFNTFRRYSLKRDLRPLAG